MQNVRKHFFRFTFDLTKDDYHDLLHGDTGEYTVRQYSKGIFGYSGLQRVTRGYKGLKGVNLLSVTKYICLKKYYTCASYLLLVLLSQQSFGHLFIARNGRFTIMKENKPTSTLNFHLISQFVRQQSPKRQFFGQNSLPKITPVRRRVLGKKLI